MRFLELNLKEKNSYPNKLDITIPIIINIKPIINSNIKTLLKNILTTRTITLDITRPKITL